MVIATVDVSFRLQFLRFDDAAGDRGIAKDGYASGAPEDGSPPAGFGRSHRDEESPLPQDHQYPSERAKDE